MLALRAPSPRLLVAAGGGLALLLTLALAYRLGPVALALPTAAIVGLVTVRHPRRLLALYIGVLVLVERSGGSPVASEALYSPVAAGISPATALLLAVALATALECFGRSELTAPQPALVAGLGLLLAAIATGCVVAYAAGVAPSAIYDSTLNFAGLALAPLLVHLLLDTPERVRTALKYAGVLVVAKALIGVVGVLGGLNVPDPALGADGGGGRLTFYEPTGNWVCLAMLLIGIAFVLRRVDVPRWVLWSLPLLAASLLLSYRRSFWIATLLGVVIVLLLGSSVLQRRLALPVLVAVGLAVWATASFAGFTERLSGTVVDRAESLNPAKVVANRQDRYRLDERANVVAELRDAPLTGLGFGVPWRARTPLPVENDNGRDYVHFALLWFWMKMGLLGALVYAALYGAGVAAASRASRRHTDPLLAAVGLGLLGAFLGLAVAETTATFIGVDQRLSAVFGAALGLSSQLRRGARPPATPLI